MSSIKHFCFLSIRRLFKAEQSSWIGYYISDYLSTSTAKYLYDGMTYLTKFLKLYAAFAPIPTEAIKYKMKLKTFLGDVILHFRDVRVWDEQKVFNHLWELQMLSS